MLGLFTKTKFTLPFQTDLHSHLLAGIDDGVQTWDESLAVIEHLQRVGFKKAITTPHIMSDQFKNTPEGIKLKALELNSQLKIKGLDFKIEAAAEYYLDEVLMQKILAKEELATFHQGYLLFETNPISEPFLLNDFIFQLNANGYKPVLAHPERYHYLQNNLMRAEDLVDRGVLLQINAISLEGYYSSAIKKVAQELIENKLCHFLGSDAHHAKHAEVYQKTIQNKYFKMACNLPLVNYDL